MYCRHFSHIISSNYQRNLARVSMFQNLNILLQRPHCCHRYRGCFSTVNYVTLQDKHVIPTLSITNNLEIVQPSIISRDFIGFFDFCGILYKLHTGNSRIVTTSWIRIFLSFCLESNIREFGSVPKEKNTFSESGYKYLPLEIERFY